MSYFEETNKTKILLINFTSDDVKAFEKEGYFVELGFIDEIRLVSADPFTIASNHYFMPHPPYEYDIFIINSSMPEEGKQYKTVHSSQLTTDILSIRSKIKATWSFSLCFLNNYFSYQSLLFGGLSHITMEDADPRDSKLQDFDVHQTFSIEKLHVYINSKKHKIKKVYKYLGPYFRDGRDSTLDCYLIPIFANKKGQKVGFYGSEYIDSDRGCVPKYIILPEFEDNIDVALGILEKVGPMVPNLFQGFGQSNWVDAAEFELPEITILDMEKQKARDALAVLEETKNKKIDDINSKLFYIKQILIADDENFEGEQRLSHCVARVLSDLGFRTELTDTILSNGKKKQDLNVFDDGDSYESLCEVKGTVNQNVAEGYYSQTIKNVKKANNPKKRGLLVVNHDYNTHPFKRTQLYKDAPDLFSGEPDDIGVISTTDLYRLVMDVRTGKLSKEDAKKIIKQSDLILYPPKNLKENKN